MESAGLERIVELSGYKQKTSCMSPSYWRVDIVWGGQKRKKKGHLLMEPEACLAVAILVDS